MKAGLASVRARTGWMTCLLALHVGATTVLAGAEGPQQGWGQPRKPAEVAAVSVASLGELSQAAKAIGVDLPSFLTAQGIEEKFSFLGADGLDSERPIGVILFTRPDWDVSQGQGVAFVLPVKPDAATVAWFDKAGGKALAGNPDTFNLNGAIFRRTQNDLIFSTSEEATLAVNDAELANLYQHAAGAKTALAHLSVDAAAIRKTSPEKYQDFINQIKASTAPTNDPGERFGQELALGWFREIGRLDLQLIRAGGELRARLAYEPASMPAASGEFNRAGMPDNIVVRLDAPIAPSKLNPWLEALRDGMIKAPMWDGGNKPATPEQARAFADMMQSASDAFLGGKAVSVGVAPKVDGGGALVYVVEQQVMPKVGDRVRRFADHFNTFEQRVDAPAQRVIAGIDHYTDGDLEVTRLKLTTPHNNVTYIDAAEGRGNVYLCGGDDAGHHLREIVSLAPKDAMPAALTGQIDLERALALASRTPESGLQNFPPAKRDELASALKGQVVNLSVMGQGNSVGVEVSIPEPLIKRVMGMLTNPQ